ncbi:hypothetical protein SAICODRAFT_20763 [Saitoella complicata NRRL Y-17804]|nr:uncharacterized protein SAICODRAFT_20763 [Saitoella complicata NRRL Y-17804]ODQ51398.1 hypothetical protein SAICODRAFT_20763 [Saitoella complicata NRRL Y-17804]
MSPSQRGAQAYIPSLKSLFPGGETAGEGSSNGSSTRTPRPESQQMSYFITTQPPWEARRPNTGDGSTEEQNDFGVRSMESERGKGSMHEFFDHHAQQGYRSESESSAAEDEDDEEDEVEQAACEGQRQRSRPWRPASLPTPPSSLPRTTPMRPDSTASSSTPGSPLSIPATIASSSRSVSDDEHPPHPRSTTSTSEPGAKSNPRPRPGVLRMPTITLPAPKKSTGRGEKMGRIRIMVVGDSGIGKTALVEAVLKGSRDVVWWDEASSTGRSRSASVTTTLSGSGGSMTAIKETWASTRAYPAWWPDVITSANSSVLGSARKRRRSSMASSLSNPEQQRVLERNMCWVDTEGYGAATDFRDCVSNVTTYLEAQFARVDSVLSPDLGHATTEDVVSILSGTGVGSGVGFVDVVLYLVLHRLKPVDIEYMRRLAPLTNLVPIIAKSDTLTDAQITALKQNINAQLDEAGIECFNWGGEGPGNLSPLAVSTLKREGVDVEMDASVLMRSTASVASVSDQEQGKSGDDLAALVESELEVLIEGIFGEEMGQWLRASSAAKFLVWRAAQQTTPTTSTTLSSVASSAEGYAMSRARDRIVREERAAQTRLSKWSEEMRQNIKERMRKEREDFERIVGGEQVKWLLGRLGEVVEMHPGLSAQANQSRAQELVSLSGAQDTQEETGDGRTAAVTWRIVAAVVVHSALAVGVGVLARDVLGRGWSALYLGGGWSGVCT